MGRASHSPDVVMRASGSVDASMKSAFATGRFGGMMRGAIDCTITPPSAVT